MSTTTEPLLSWLREMMSKKGMNTAAMSDAANVARPRLRKLLTGREPMLVSELLGLCEALGSAWGLEPPGLRAVVARVVADRSGLATYARPLIPELARSHP